ncbi:MAG: hypothetical protein N2483_04980 [Burkholderiaceae bacterium]|nr:hypothetical protein [Burkholderiaceae bacterium]
MRGAATQQEAYAARDLPWMPPQLRAGRADVPAATKSARRCRVSEPGVRLNQRDLQRAMQGHVLAQAECIGICRNRGKRLPAGAHPWGSASSGPL